VFTPDVRRCCASGPRRHLLRRHGDASDLQPAEGLRDFKAYQQWAALRRMLCDAAAAPQAHVSQLGDAGAPPKSRIDSELASQRGPKVDWPVPCASPPTRRWGFWGR